MCAEQKMYEMHASKLRLCPLKFVLFDGTGSRENLDIQFF